jgi:UDP-N-acetylenolpyruvoylglucosamine reductase
MLDVMNKEQIFADLKHVLSPESILRMDESLAKKTTLRVGGPADVYVEPCSEFDLARVFRFCAQADIPFTVLGKGSNLLIRDGGIRGVVCRLIHRSFSEIKVSGQYLRCGAGASLKDVANTARQNCLAGLEFLGGIPGSVGGALRMNAGAMGSATFERVEHVRYMDREGEAHEVLVTEVKSQYRSCPMLKTHIALGAIFRGDPDSKEAIVARTDDFNNRRWKTQPKDPSAGCIFKNPETIPAGKLVQELGLKSQRVGGAKVSPIHGNFIVNEKNATARDVLELIEMIRDKAKAERGIELETEVEILGEDSND